MFAALHILDFNFIFNNIFTDLLKDTPIEAPNYVLQSKNGVIDASQNSKESLKNIFVPNFYQLYFLTFLYGFNLQILWMSECFTTSSINFANWFEMKLDPTWA